MKKILFIASSQVSIPPMKGGAIEDIIFEIAKSLGKNFKPIIVSRSKFYSDDIECLNIPSKLRKNKLFGILEDINYGFKCIEAIKNKKPDIVHLNTTFTSIPIALFLSSKDRPKIIYTSHSPSWTVPDSEIGRINVFFSFLEGIVMKRVDVITAVSESMRTGIINKLGISPRKILTIPNFSKTINYKKYKWKKIHKIKGPIVLFVGKLTETKGIRYLIGSIPHVIKNYPDTKFVLVGALEHEQNLSSKNPWFGMVKTLGIEKNVNFLGSLSKEDLYNIYDASDVFVLPTMREGMPLVILEAASFGLPIVTTKISGIPEILDEKSAIFVPRKDSIRLANALIELISNSKKAYQLGKNAKKASINLRKEVVIKKFMKIYGEL